MITKKKCRVCHKSLPITKFSKRNDSEDGFRNECKNCSSILHKKYYENHKEDILNRQSKYNKEHRDERTKYSRYWCERNSRKCWASGTIWFHGRQGIKIKIDRESLIDLALNAFHCVICDTELDWSRNKGSVRQNSPTLDRVNNEEEIRIDNIQILCHKCNIIKSDMPMKEFIAYCCKVCKKFNDCKKFDNFDPKIGRIKK